MHFSPKKKKEKGWQDPHLSCVTQGLTRRLAKPCGLNPLFPSLVLTKNRSKGKCLLLGSVSLSVLWSKASQGYIKPFAPTDYKDRLWGIVKSSNPLEFPNFLWCNLHLPNRIPPQTPLPKLVWDRSSSDQLDCSMIHKRPKQRPLPANQQPTIVGRHYRWWSTRTRNSIVLCTNFFRSLLFS